MKRKLDFNNRATDQVAIHNKINEMEREREVEKRKEDISKRRTNIIGFFITCIIFFWFDFPIFIVSFYRSI